MKATIIPKRKSKKSSQSNSYEEFKLTDLSDETVKLLEKHEASSTDIYYNKALDTISIGLMVVNFPGVKEICAFSYGGDGDSKDPLLLLGLKKSFVKIGKL